MSQSGYYVAYTDCGCPVATCVSRSVAGMEHIADDIAGYIRRGLTVKFHESLKDTGVLDRLGACPHETLAKLRSERALRKAIPLKVRLADIAVKWLGEAYEGDRERLEQETQEAIDDCLTGVDAYQICESLNRHFMWDCDDELCAAIRREIEDFEN